MPAPTADGKCCHETVLSRCRGCPYGTPPASEEAVHFDWPPINLSEEPMRDAYSHADGSRECRPVRCPTAVAAADAVFGASTNPKRTQGMKKPPVHLVPDSAVIHTAMAFKDGARKYGPFNWRDDPVDITTYIAAARRHLAAFMAGEQVASDSSVHHLAHAAACCFILLDAETSGSLIDDRPKAQELSALIERLTERAA